MLILLNDFYEFYNLKPEELTEKLKLDIYNDCPCCRVVNQPMILGCIDYPIIEKRKYRQAFVEVFGNLQEFGTPELVVGEYEKNGDFSYFEREELVGRKVNVLFQCENIKCKKIFIVHYSSRLEEGQVISTKVESTSPNMVIDIEQNVNISTISEKYYDIYKQAYQAELMGLTDICGMGYRKALEFLIKDYVIYLNKDEPTFDKAKLLEKFLGRVIKDELDNSKVKEIAQRAVWLGNDETHYFRKWGEKDVSDLKMLIEMIVYMIEMELAYSKALVDMPSGR